jgi:hypothetical protein
MQRLAIKRGMPFGSAYLHEAALDTFVAAQWHRVPGVTLIKAHEMGPQAVGALQSGLAAGVCTFRDPRDCVASDLVFMRRGLEQTLKRMTASLHCLGAVEAIDRILFVRYEDMMTHRHGEICRIAGYLGLPLDVNVVAR